MWKVAQWRPGLKLIKMVNLSVFSADKGSTTVVVKADGPMTIVMGYAAQTIDVGANRTFNRHESTAAVSTTYNEEFNKRSSRNISNSLYGYGLGLTTLRPVPG